MKSTWKELPRESREILTAIGRKLWKYCKPSNQSTIKITLKRAFILITLGILVHHPGKAMNYYVAVDGNDDGGGTPEQPFATIGKAVGIADPGDTIFVRGGIYYSNSTIVINRNGLEDNYCSLMSMRGADNASTIAENCWAFENGYLEDGTDPGSQANGNGFKMGGSDDKTLRHDYTLIHCLAFKNKAKGFDQNSNMGSMILYHCTGHNNMDANYKIYKELAAGEELVIKNCAVLGPTGDIASFAVTEANSWMESFTVTEEDFVSVDDQSAYGARKEDGSLPDITYLHLMETSDLVDAGVDVGLPFNGIAPDIGCFERESPTIEVPLEIPDISIKIYPNPASKVAQIIPRTGFSGPFMVSISDITGRQVKQFNFDNIPGNHELTLDLSGIQQGIYVIQVYNGRKAGSVMLRID